jgi:hypothetical protein
MRYCLCLLALTAAVFARDGGETLRGKLAIRANAPAALETADHKTVELSGDDTISKILSDTRLNGFDVQVKGHFTAPDKFQVDPSHEHSLLVHSEGKLKIITYYCDVCNIRDYTPGPCRCCQKELVLELRDPDAR